MNFGFKEKIMLESILIHKVFVDFSLQMKFHKLFSTFGLHYTRKLLFDVIQLEICVHICSIKLG